jgi:hypothetical protein
MTTVRELDWFAHLGQQTRIYRNLNNGRMSIQAKVGKIGKSWKVVGHVLDCVLIDVKFHVSEATRQKVIRLHRRTVHAWGQGTLIGVSDPAIYALIDLSYNPYVSGSFLERGTTNKISHCKYLVVRDNRVLLTPDAVDDERCCPLLRVLWGGKLTAVPDDLLRSA